MRNWLLKIFIPLIIVAFALWFFREKSQTSSPTTPKEQKDFAVLAQNLEIPWALAFLPDSRLLVTERPGKVKEVSPWGAETQEITFSQPLPVKHQGEGGLLGIAIHPQFTQNRFVYLYYAFQNANNELANRVSRFKLANQTLSGEKIIINDIPGAANHNGGRIKFGPDGFLYVTTGDAQNSSLAQDTNSLAGKILRVTSEGEPAPDNPFGNLVYSYGHRNPQGLAWDRQGRLWATEHGRSGVQSGLDELNLIEKGENYGWPVIQGEEKKEGMETPFLNSGPEKTWAPSGIAFWNESLFFAGLRGEALFEIQTNEEPTRLKEHFPGKFGRLREVVLGPDGFLYLTTSNRDGRGEPADDDDKIIRLKPSSFFVTLLSDD